LTHSKNSLNFRKTKDQKLIALKTIPVLIIATILVGLVGCSTALVEDIPIESVKDVITFQQYMLDEINFARTKPAEYAELRLKAENNNSKDNGSYNYLKSLSQVEPISFNQSLNLSASNYAALLAEKNLIEHYADGSPLNRALRAGFTGTATGENIAVASENCYNAKLNSQSAAIGFVRILIIDEGVANLGHRLVILNSKYKTVGIGYTQNSATPLLNYVVQDFGNL
jgi:uncharacterized protein YkwD